MKPDKKVNIDLDQADEKTIVMLITEILGNTHLITIEHYTNASRHQQWLIESDQWGEIGIGQNLITATRDALNEIIKRRVPRL